MKLLRPGDHVHWRGYGRLGDYRDVVIQVAGASGGCRGHSQQPPDMVEGGNFRLDVEPSLRFAMTYSSLSPYPFHRFNLSIPECNNPVCRMGHCLIVCSYNYGDSVRGLEVM